MPAVYESQGISFVYPSDWTVDESDSGANRSAVTVQSGRGAFWTVVREGRATDAQSAAEAALRAMREEYDDLDAEPVTDEVAGHELRGFDVNFICLDCTSTSLIRATNTDAGTLVIFCQADDREFADVADVFGAMTVSLLKA